MEYGKISGIRKPISRMVQGCTMLGGPDIKKDFALLDAVYKDGCTAFDTAHVYSGGDSERVLGRWMQKRRNRDKVVIITKGAHPNADRKRVTPYDIASDLHDSLARLKTDYIDLYLLHRDDEELPVGPIVESLNEHRREGKILAFGGSNWTHKRIARANQYAKSRGLVGFAASSPNFTLARQAENPWPGCVSIAGPAGKSARKWYAKMNMPLFFWSSLAGGFFSGRFTPKGPKSSSDYWDLLTIRCYCTPDNFKRLERARQLGKEKGLNPPQIATAFVLCQPLNGFALVGCKTGREFRENAAALAVKLTPRELAWLNLED